MATPFESAAELGRASVPPTVPPPPLPPPRPASMGVPSPRSTASPFPALHDGDDWRHPGSPSRQSVDAAAFPHAGAGVGVPSPTFSGDGHGVATPRYSPGATCGSPHSPGSASAATGSGFARSARRRLMEFSGSPGGSSTRSSPARHGGSPRGEWPAASPAPFAASPLPYTPASLSPLPQATFATPVPQPPVTPASGRGGFVARAVRPMRPSAANTLPLCPCTEPDIDVLARRLPKVELHLHLHSGIRLSTLQEFATQAGRTGVDVSAVMDKPRSLQRCFELFDIIHAAVTLPRHITRITREVMPATLSLLAPSRSPRSSCPRLVTVAGGCGSRQRDVPGVAHDTAGSPGHWHDR